LFKPAPGGREALPASFKFSHQNITRENITLFFSMEIISALFLVLLVGICIGEELHPDSVPMKIVNKANAPLDLFWVNTFEPNEPLVRQVSKPIRNNSDTIINSFDSHKFMVRYYSQRHGDSQVYFVKSPHEETVTVYSSNSDTVGDLSVVQSTKYDDIKSTVRAATEACKSFGLGDNYDSCVTDEVTRHVGDMSSSLQELKKYRDRMATKLRNYTCADDSMETSKALRTDTLYLGQEKRRVESKTLLDLESSKVWVVHDFISDDECDVLIKHGNPRLKRATVAAEDGTSIVSNTRKAQQASYNFPKDNPSQDALWPLYNRIIDFVNRHSDYNLKPEGQEEFAIIQYNPEDEYAPHCDADCAGESYTNHGRVATAVLYCKVADRGGGTSFTKADVFVKPKKGDVTIFTYKGDDGKMDTGYTEHSSCPIIEGEKWVTTAWLRQGVSTDDPWGTYDPSGIPIFDTLAEDVSGGAMMEEQAVDPN